jgi:hypothetical protein
MWSMFSAKLRLVREPRAGDLHSGSPWCQRAAAEFSRNTGTPRHAAAPSLQVEAPGWQSPVPEAGASSKQGRVYLEQKVELRGTRRAEEGFLVCSIGNNSSLATQTKSCGM